MHCKHSSRLVAIQLSYVSFTSYKTFISTEGKKENSDKGNKKLILQFNF